MTVNSGLYSGWSSWWAHCSRRCPPSWKTPWAGSKAECWSAGRCHEEGKQKGDRSWLAHFFLNCIPVVENHQKPKRYKRKLLILPFDIVNKMKILVKTNYLSKIHYKISEVTNCAHLCYANMSSSRTHLYILVSTK